MKKAQYFNVFLIVLIIAFISCGKKPAPQPVGPIPSPAQLSWHEMELTAFIHFTTNTFTNLEWGYGDENPSVFNPTALNVEQWAQTLKDVGFKMIILTCKHHDGFCLWPSKFTEHSIKNSPYKNGKGDVVKELSEACKKFGLKFGVYLSPWDRNHADYGTEKYINYYRNELKEIVSDYGPVTEIWLDGANGGDGYYGGSRETRKINGRTYYDWPNTIAMIRKIEPDVLFFSDGGPSIRWVGNEKGVAGETNWNSISTDTLYAGKPGIENLLGSGSPDGKQWVPAEVDVSIRPGWFFHAKEDSLVKTPQQLLDIYLTSVGRGSNLLLNVPPDKRGLFNEADVASLKGFRKLLDHEFGKNMALHSKVTASNTRGNDETYSSQNLTDADKETYWATDDKIDTANFTIELKKPSMVKYVVLQEYIKLGQRVSGFTIKAMQHNLWTTVATGSTIGYKRILKTIPVITGKIMIEITGSKSCPVLSNVEVY